MSDTSEMRADPSRGHLPETGVYVRALTSDGWDAVDIAHLDAASLVRWMDEDRNGRSNGHRVLLMLLGHDQEVGLADEEKG